MTDYNCPICKQHRNSKIHKQGNCSKIMQQRRKQQQRKNAKPPKPKKPVLPFKSYSDKQGRLLKTQFC